MSSTLNPACPLCGLRFANKPLLDLHVREDHRPRARHAQSSRRDPGGTRAAPPRADRPSRRKDPAPGPSRTAKEVTAMTSTRLHQRGSRAMTAPRRALRALRYVNDELLRASEAIIRSARAPRPRPQASAPAAVAAQAPTATERADRAA